MRGIQLVLRWNGQRVLVTARRFKSDDSKEKRIEELRGSDRVNKNLAGKPLIVNGMKHSTKEPLHEKIIMKDDRSRTGDTTEHAFPVNPSYPRVAREQNAEERAQSDSIIKKIQVKGRRKLIAMTSFFLLGVAFLYEALVRNPEQYMIPIGQYNLPSYREYLQIDHVIFLEIAVDGQRLGRIHIGLFDRDAPIFCENMHRLATGNNPAGKTLRGTLFWKSTGACLYGGDTKGLDGRDGLIAMDDLPYLPEDKHNNMNVPFGCYAGGGFIHCLRNANDSNFLIFLEEGRVAVKGDYTCFGMVLKGYGLVEQISRLPRKPFPFFVDRVEVVDCGISPLDGNRAAIDQTLKRFHKARVQRFLATDDYHKDKHEVELIQKQRRDKMKEKRDQVEEELQALASAKSS